MATDILSQDEFAYRSTGHVSNNLFKMIGGLIDGIYSHIKLMIASDFRPTNPSTGPSYIAIYIDSIFYIYIYVKWQPACMHI